MGDQAFDIKDRLPTRSKMINMKGQAGLAVYRYPPITGAGQEANAEHIVTRDMIFAFANGSISSMVLTRKAFRIEKMAMLLALSSTDDSMARTSAPGGAAIRIAELDIPHT